jgi:hypothetical protein
MEPRFDRAVECLTHQTPSPLGSVRTPLPPTSPSSRPAGGREPHLDSSASPPVRRAQESKRSNQSAKRRGNLVVPTAGAKRIALESPQPSRRRRRRYAANRSSRAVPDPSPTLRRPKGRSIHPCSVGSVPTPPSLAWWQQCGSLCTAGVGSRDSSRFGDSIPHALVTRVLRQQCGL